MNIHHDFIFKKGWNVTMKKFDVVLVEKEGDSGLTIEEITAMYNILLSENQGYPIEIYNKGGGESSAMGFITPKGYDKMWADSPETDPEEALKDYIGNILGDMNLEHENCEYHFMGIDIFLTRNI